MLHILLVWIFAALALLITSRLVKGFEISNFKAAMVASFLIGLLNALLKPILFILTLPINILTLGLFTFVVNAFILRLASGMMSGFKIDKWGSAILGAVVLVIVQLLINMLF